MGREDGKVETGNESELNRTFRNSFTYLKGEAVKEEEWKRRLKKKDQAVCEEIKGNAEIDNVGWRNVQKNDIGGKRNALKNVVHKRKRCRQKKVGGRKKKKREWKDGGRVASNV